MTRLVLGSLLLLTTAASPASTATDPFLWLEDIEGKQALAWVETENERSRAVLEADPHFAALYRDASEIVTSEARIPFGKLQGDHVVNFWRDLSYPRGVLRRAPLDGYTRGKPDWEALLDLDWLARQERENWVFKGYDCLAPDYDRCLIRLSRGGGDASVLREFSVTELRFPKDGFRVPEAKSAAAWLDADRLLVATDWGPDSLTVSGYPREVRLWERGRPLADARTVFTGSTDDVRTVPVVYLSEGVSYPILIRQMTFFEREYLYLDRTGEAVDVPLPRRSSIEGVQAGRAIVLLQEDWSHGGHDYGAGSLIAFDLTKGGAEAVYAPAPTEAIQGVQVSDQAVLVTVLDDVTGRAKRLVRRGGRWRVRTLALPDAGVISLVSTGTQGDALVSYESLTAPDALYYLSSRARLSKAFQMPALYDATDVLVEQHFATSADGTRVPYFVMGRKGVLAAGNAPTIQYGYGGFGLSTLPHYFQEDARAQHGALAGRLWVDQGGVFVLANIRGGGEYGPAWHTAALGNRRHKAFEDFFAVSEDLIRRGVTTSDRLGAMGRSNGGLLMGVALTQRPDLYAAIDCGMPLIDMLRYHQLLAGASWMAEYGNPDEPADREAIIGYSPYEHLSGDAKYPEVFIYTSTLDDRVHPGHARKLAAKLQALGDPFLYYENEEGGHRGAANQEQLAYRIALEYTYFSRALMRSPATASGD